MTTHGMLAAIIRTPELALSEMEAGSLATALDTVNKFYDVKVAAKTVAWINLASVAGMIYGSRLVAIRARTRAERAQNVAATVTPTHGPAPTERQNAADTPAPASTEAAYAGIPDDFIGGAFPGMAPFTT